MPWPAPAVPSPTSSSTWSAKDPLAPSSKGTLPPLFNYPSNGLILTKAQYPYRDQTNRRHQSPQPRPARHQRPRRRAKGNCNVDESEAERMCQCHGILRVLSDGAKVVGYHGVLWRRECSNSGRHFIRVEFNESDSEADGWDRQKRERLRRNISW